MRLGQRVVAALFALLCEGAVANPTPPPTMVEPTRPMDIDYEIRRMPSGDRYQITLRFKGDHSGRSVLRIPSEWASAEHAEQGIEALAVLTPHARLEDTDDAQVKRIVHRSGERLAVRYRLRQILDGEPNATWPTNYLPTIRPGYFQWIGWTTWVVPVASDDAAVRIHVHFVNLPQDFSFASSFGLDPTDVAFAGPLLRFRESTFVGGDFRLRSRAVEGGHVVTAVRGAWPFRDSELADRVATIVDGERVFWRDTTQRDFLVTLMPIAAPPRAVSIGGTGLTRSFATWSTPIESLDELDGLFTHEYFHTWNAEGLGTPVEPEAIEYWFSEGFTDYYKHLLRLRWHMLTLEQYAAEYDSVLRSLAGLRERELPNADIGTRFFAEGRTIGKLPYWRGMLLAARWDHEIRTTSGGKRSLDDAMRSLLAEHRRGVERLDATRIARAMRAEGVSDVDDDIERYVDQGKLPTLVAGTLTDCISVSTVEDRPLAVGFNFEASMRKRKVSGVEPDGPAYAAGLRDDQIVRGMSVTQRIDVPASVSVQDTGDGPIHVVTFLPMGRAVQRQHVEVRDDLDANDRDRCLAELGVPR